MIVFVCDTCGNQYQPYAKTKYSDGNAVTIVKIEKGGKVNPQVKFHICPKCMEKFHEFIKDQLVQPDTFAERFYNERKG